MRYVPIPDFVSPRPGSMLTLPILAVALVVATPCERHCAAWAQEAAALAPPSADAVPAGNPPEGKPPTDAVRADTPAALTTLTGDSTLAQWRTATPTERSRVAVALARNRLAPDANKLEVATAAMEITGCLTATARDAKFDAWKVAPTAATCLSAPERKEK